MSRRYLTLGLVLLSGLTLLLVLANWVSSVRAGQAVAPNQQATALPRNESIVVRAYYDDPAMVAQFAAEVEPWFVNPKEGYLVVGVSPDQLNLLIFLGFQVEVDQALTAEVTTPRTINASQGGGIPGYACYRTVTETLASAHTLAANYPGLAQTVDVGDSWLKVQNAANGYDLLVLVLTNPNTSGPKPVLFMTTGLHAREYTPPELVTRFAEHLVQNYGSDPDITWLLDYHEIHMLLQSNPDSRVVAENQVYWRKNQNNSNGCSATLPPLSFGSHFGTDLNRNFEFQWGCCNGSSTSSCSETYRGTSAASEPEVQAIQFYGRQIFADQRGPALEDAAPDSASGIYMDIHSHSELVIWPCGFDHIVAPNGSEMQTLGRKLADFTDYYPEQAVDLYPTDGTTDDFFYGDLGVAAFTYELGTAFFQSCTTFENTIWPDNLPSLIYAAKASRAPYLLPSGPDASAPALSEGLIQVGQAVTLTVDLDDTKFNNQNGTEPTQNIAAGVYQIDVPYWITQTTPVSFTLSAVDGSFNSPTESAQAVLDTSGWLPGQHTIFVRGQDASGQWGVVSAVILDVMGVGSGTLQGSLSLQGRSNHAGAQVIAWDGPTPVFTNTTDSAGDYAMLLPVGDYDLTVTLPGFLPASRAGVIVQDGLTTELPELLLLSGDINGGWH